MPISDCDVRDPRIRRTRNLLHGALRKLMVIKRFDDISVQDITGAATVNRATFYDHYTDKYALLDAMVAAGFHKLLADRKVSYDGSCASAAGPIVRAACDYLGECHASPDACQKQTAFEPLIEAAIISAIRRVLLGGVPQASSTSAFQPEMVASTASWAIFGAVKQWFNTADRPPPEKIVPIIVRLVMPILESANHGQKTVK
jgi:AcrR family transcriptional regulator